MVLDATDVKKKAVLLQPVQLLHARCHRLERLPPPEVPLRMGEGLAPNTPLECRSGVFGIPTFKKKSGVL